MLRRVWDAVQSTKRTIAIRTVATCWAEACFHYRLCPNEDWRDITLNELIEGRGHDVGVGTKSLVSKNTAFGLFHKNKRALAAPTVSYKVHFEYLAVPTGDNRSRLWKESFCWLKSGSRMGKLGARRSIFKKNRVRE